MIAKMKTMRYIFFLLNLIAIQAVGQNVRLNNIERARDTASVPINIAYPRADTLGVQRYHRDYWATQNDTLKWYVINTLTGDTTLNQSVKVQTSSGDTSLLSLIIATFTENQEAYNTFTTITFDDQIVYEGTEISHSESTDNSRFVFNRSGVFFVTTKIKLDTTTNQTSSIRFLKNGSDVLALSTIDGRGTPYAFLSFYAVVDSADYVELQALTVLNAGKWVAGETTVSVQSVKGATGPQGPQGVAGTNGTNGIGIDTAYVATDSLYIITTLPDTINAGYVTGDQGPQGVQGFSIVDAYVLTDTLYLITDQPDTINAGYIAEGLDGVGVDTAYLSNDSLYIVLTNLDTINAGYINAGTGTVTSVGLSLPGQFTVTNSPVTTSGTLTAAWVTQPANNVFAGPASGSPATPAFRLLGENDIPAHDYTKVTGITPLRLLGRYSSPTGAAQLITIGTGLNLNASTGDLTATNNGTVTSVGIASTDLSVSGSPITTSGNITLNINNAAVTNAKMATNSVSTSNIIANNVTFDKIAQVSSPSLIGRYSAGTGNIQTVKLGPGISYSNDTLKFLGSSNWTLSGTTLYPLLTSTNVVIGGTSMAGTGLKFQVDGTSYTTGDAYIGGVSTLSNAFRGYLNVRIREGFNDNGGIALHSSSGNTHGVTAIQNNNIFSRYDGNNFGTTIRSIGTGNFPITIEGISNSDGTSFVSAITLTGYRRSGTNVTSVADNSRVLQVRNGGSDRLEIFGNGYTRVTSTSALKVPVGTTAQRPATPAQGDIRYNTTTGKFEGYNGSTWVDFH
jgi:hypothetical protein